MSLRRTVGLVVTMSCCAPVLPQASQGGAYAQAPEAIVAGRYVAPDGTLKPSAAIVLSDPPSRTGGLAGPSPYVIEFRLRYVDRAL